MTAATTLQTGEHSARAGWAAIASGAAGLIAFTCLTLFLETQVDTFADTGVMPPTGQVLLTVNFISAALQALLMIPGALALRALTLSRSPAFGFPVLIVGAIGFAGVALLRLLPLINPAVSDILFMAPTGFVGAWLLAINLISRGVLPIWLRIIGAIAALGLVVVSMSFFFLGGLAVLTDGPYAYANDEDFHAAIGTSGRISFILFPVWAIFVGRKLLEIPRIT